MEEWFDVVDDCDRVIGRRVRSEVHRLRLFHRAAHVLVFNRAGELFLQKRSLRKDNSPGLWDSSAAGHLMSGEDYPTAARRELVEELGLTGEPEIEPLFKIDACPETEYEFAWVYRCVEDGPFLLDPEEIDEGCWLSPDEVEDWLANRARETTTSFQLIWRRLGDAGSHDRR